MSHPDPAPAGAHPAPRVLVIAAKAATRDAVRAALSRLGRAADAVADAEQALARAFERPPDLALVDLTLPGGREVARKLRALLGRYVLLVALSDGRRSDEHREALAAGFDAVAGPTDLESLRRWLIVAGSDPRRESARPGCCRWETFSAPEAVSTVPGRVMAAMVEQGYPEEDVFAVRLALEETLVNAIKHGNRGDPSKRVRVSHHVGPERVSIEVEDESDGFGPERVPAPTAVENLERPCGRGLLLVRSYLRWVRYHDRRNRVLLCKDRSAGPGRSSSNGAEPADKAGAE